MPACMACSGRPQTVTEAASATRRWLFDPGTVLTWVNSSLSRCNDHQYHSTLVLSTGTSLTVSGVVRQEEAVPGELSWRIFRNNGETVRCNVQSLEIDNT